MKTINELLIDIKIINKYNIDEYTNFINDLRVKTKFYDQHNLQEEHRISLLKLELIEDLFKDYETMYNDLIKLIKT